MPNVASLINKSNIEKLNNKQCNSINKALCPLKGKCQYEYIVYKVEVYNNRLTTTTTTNNNNGKK